jgi:hypothetical protein
VGEDDDGGDYGRACGLVKRNAAKLLYKKGHQRVRTNVCVLGEFFA